MDDLMPLAGEVRSCANSFLGLLCTRGVDGFRSFFGLFIVPFVPFSIEVLLGVLGSVCATVNSDGWVVGFFIRIVDENTRFFANFGLCMVCDIAVGLLMTLEALFVDFFLSVFFVVFGVLGSACLCWCFCAFFSRRSFV